MTQDELKNEVAKAALKYVTHGTIIGVGTGSTANFFINHLASIKDSIKGAVASSIDTANRLKRNGIRVVNLNEVDEISVYIDGADESDHKLNLINIIKVDNSYTIFFKSVCSINRACNCTFNRVFNSG